MRRSLILRVACLLTCHISFLVLALPLSTSVCCRFYCFQIADCFLYVRSAFCLYWAQELKSQPRNYDVWFDYIRLEEANGEQPRIREIYERAIANVPLEQVLCCAVCLNVVASMLTALLFYSDAHRRRNVHGVAISICGSITRCMRNLKPRFAIPPFLQLLFSPSILFAFVCVSYVLVASDSHFIRMWSARVPCTRKHCAFVPRLLLQQAVADGCTVRTATNEPGRRTQDSGSCHRYVPPASAV